MSVPRSETSVLRSSRKTSESAFTSAIEGLTGGLMPKGIPRLETSAPYVKENYQGANICYLSIAIMSVTGIEPSTNSLPGNMHMVCYVLFKVLTDTINGQTFKRHAIGKQVFSVLFY